VKHLIKNSQQINYATGHDNSYANRERNPSSIFKGSPCAELPWFPARSSSITAAVALVDRDLLTRMRDEMNYQIDVCRITKDGHIERL
jgi:hypothetical protein